MTAAADVERTVETPAIDVPATLRPAAILPRDPTVSLEADRFARATITPEGPASIVVRWSPDRHVAGVRLRVHGL